MGWRYRKSFPLAGGAFRLNVSGRGVGWSAGVPGSGLRYTSGPTGKAGASGGGCLGLALLLALGFVLLRGCGDGRDFSGERKAPYTDPAHRARVNHGY